MTGIATELDAAVSKAVTGLRKAGYSWAEIAVRLGVTRQAAQQRWGHWQWPDWPDPGDHLGTTRYARGQTTRT
jgi:hypothetical protein